MPDSLPVWRQAKLLGVWSRKAPKGWTDKARFPGRGGREASDVYQYG